MRRCAPLLALAIVVVAPFAGQAQQAAKVWRIGYLSSLGALPQATDRFRQGLRGLGYMEGRNIDIEYRWADGDYSRVPKLANELVSLNPDLIVCLGPPAALAVKAATKTIPVVFFAGNPVSAGIVSSLAKPDGNLTGLDTFAQELDAKRLELLKAVLPRADRVGLLLNPENPLAGLQQHRAAAAAKALGMRPHFLEAMEQPTKFKFVINLKTAKALGLTIPQSLLLRADEVIQ